MKRILSQSKQNRYRYAFAALLLSAMFSAPLTAQNKEYNEVTNRLGKWYIGADAGVSFGRGTFCSFGADKTRTGYGFGLLGGYHINRFLSTEAELRYSHLGLGAYDCCKDLYLASDGNRYYAPLAGAKNDRYGDLFSSVNLYELGLHLNVDFVRMFRPESRWSFLVSPAVYGVASKADVKTTEGENSVLKGGNQMHFGAGGDLGVGYQVNPRVNLRLYTGMTYLTGKGMDALPQTEHNTNYTWNSGVKVTIALGKSKRQQPLEVIAEVPQLTVVPEPAPQPTVEVKVEQTPTPPSQPTEKVVYETAIYFAHSQCTRIEKSEDAAATGLLKAIAAYPDASIVLVGWTDKTGTDAINKTIATRRAETVKRYLVSKGIAAERISTQGNGPDVQAADNAKARHTQVTLIITEK